MSLTHGMLVTCRLCGEKYRLDSLATAEHGGKCPAKGTGTMATKDDFADLRDDAERAEPTHERNRLRALLAAIDTSRADAETHARGNLVLLAEIKRLRREVAQADRAAVAALADAVKADADLAEARRASRAALDASQRVAAEALAASRAETAALRGHLVLVLDEAQGTIGAAGPGIRIGTPTMPLSTAKRLKRQIEDALGDGLAETIAAMTGYADELRTARASEAAAVRRAEVAEARLEVGAAFRALSRASRDVKSGDPAAPGRKAAAHMRLDAVEARVLALGAAVDEEGER